MKSYKDVAVYLVKLNMPQHQGLIVVLAEGDIGARMRISEWCTKRGYPVPKHFTSMCKPKGEGECSMVRMSPDEFGVCAVKMEDQDEAVAKHVRAYLDDMTPIKETQDG